jgi:hypothetical protein
LGFKPIDIVKQVKKIISLQKSAASSSRCLKGSSLKQQQYLLYSKFLLSLAGSSFSAVKTYGMT